MTIVGMVDALQVYNPTFADAAWIVPLAFAGVSRDSVTV